MTQTPVAVVKPSGETVFIACRPRPPRLNHVGRTGSLSAFVLFASADSSRRRELERRVNGYGLSARSLEGLART